MSATEPNLFFVGHVWDNSFQHGINMNSTSTDDSWLIEHNTFGSATGGTTPCINGTVQSGAAHITAFNNNGGCAGGFFISHGVTQCKILYNQIEQPATSTEANSAIIDLIGDTYAIDGCEIVGNNINAHAFVTNNIRVDHATNTHIENNVLSLKSSGGGIGILLTANASNTRYPWNEFGLSGGTAVTTNSTSVFAQRGPDGVICSSPAYSFLSSTNTGMSWVPSVGLIDFCISGTEVMVMFSGGAQFGSSQGVAWDSVVSPSGFGGDTSIGRLAPGVVGAGGSTPGTKTGIIQSANTARVASDFTLAGNTSLQTITGLSWTLPAVALNYSFHCELAYSQATAAVADALGIQAATNAPTNIFATGKVWTNATGTNADGVLATLSTTTATNILTFTPSATVTNFVAELNGTFELPASANTINIMASQSNAADLLTIKRGSYCQLF